MASFYLLVLEIQAPFKRYSVKLGQCVGENDEIWTFSMNTDSENVPIVLVDNLIEVKSNL